MVKDHVIIANEKTKTNHLNNPDKSFDDSELLLWQMSKIFDFLTGNLDGHEGNAFVSFDKNNKLSKAVNFDYDKAFPAKEPKAITNQYKWGQLSISKNFGFTEETKHVLKDMLKKKEIVLENFKKITCKGERKNFNKAQEKLLLSRFIILEKIITGEIKTLEDLAKTKK